ncbi:four helix bundle protein [Cyanobacterium aponinum AL20118]|uniref:Four helix bundle protein n=1 Tax=Cyanobacterium aponinum AL20115 TaxID=3090662 RepID=A0AAF0ZBW2_9CHRO|nr:MULTISPECIES: four helix bundle protein [Cyanobacterium]WPF87335.1 four helix bundle protein [Cyanobacterium aponinum AL20115]WVL00476.1 four helix bundle protein [Cyanobacterium sp. Dongsha4]
MTETKQGNREQATGNSVNDYKDLRVWKKGIDIAEQCYRLTQSFPKEEIYGLTSQIRRSAVSISSNIAEGYGRRTTAEYIRFLNIAQGSCNELETQLIIAQRIGYCTSESIQEINQELLSINRMLISLINKLKEKF